MSTQSMRQETFHMKIAIRIISGPRVKFVQLNAFKSPVVYTTDRSKAVVLMLFLFCVAL